MNPTEHEECVTFREWLDWKHLFYTKTTQETYTSSWNQKRKNKKEGLHKGLSDYIVVLKDVLLFIEMKRVKGGQVSKEQKEWLDRLNEIDNVEGAVCRGADEAIKFVETYL